MYRPSLTRHRKKRADFSSSFRPNLLESHGRIYSTLRLFLYIYFFPRFCVPRSLIDLSFVFRNDENELFRYNDDDNDDDDNNINVSDDDDDI